MFTQIGVQVVVDWFWFIAVEGFNGFGDSCYTAQRIDGAALARRLAHLVHNSSSGAATRGFRRDATWRGARFSR
jgi:hypothetical protein